MTTTVETVYVNQYHDLWKTALMWWFWNNGPTHAPDDMWERAHETTRTLIEKYAHIGTGNPVNGHVYRVTEQVSSSGFYDGAIEMVPWATHTVNLDETRDATARCERATKHLWNGQIDDGMPRRGDWFERVGGFYLYDQVPNKAIHVNCAAGASRAPSMAYFLVRATTKLPVLDCKAMVYAANSIMGRNIGLTYWQDAERTLRRMNLVPDAWELGARTCEQ